MAKSKYLQALGAIVWPNPRPLGKKTTSERRTSHRVRDYYYREDTPQVAVASEVIALTVSATTTL